MSGNVWSHSIRLHQASLGISDKCFQNVSNENEQFFIRTKCLISLSQCSWRKGVRDVTMAWVHYLHHAHFDDSVRVATCIFICVSVAIAAAVLFSSFIPMSSFLLCAVQHCWLRMKRIEPFIGSKKRTTLKADQILWGRDIVQCKHLYSLHKRINRIQNLIKDWCVVHRHGNDCFVIFYST